MALNPVIAGVLEENEVICARVTGRPDMWLFGGPAFPSQGMVLATDRRILYFTKAHKSATVFEEELQYDHVVRFAVYRDVMHGVVGLLSRSLHLQDDEGRVVRLVAPEGYEAFGDYIAQRIPGKAKYPREK